MLKILLLIVIVYFMSLSTVSGQKASETSKSERTEKQSLVKIDSLLQNFKDFYQIDKEKALNELHVAEMLAKDSQNYELHVYVLSEAASIFYQLNDLKQALESSKKANVIMRSHPNEVSLNYKVRWYKITKSIYSKTNTGLEIAKDLLNEFELLLLNNREDAQFYNYARDIGSSFYVINQLEKAEKWAQIAFSGISKEDSLSYLTTGVLLASIYSSNNAIAKSLKLMNSLKEMADSAPKEHLINFYGNFAQLYLMNNESEKAVALFTSLFNKMDNSPSGNFHKHNLAFRISEIYFNLKKNKEALEYATISYKYSIEYDIKTKYVELLKLMQDIYIAIGNYEKAYFYLVQETAERAIVYDTQLKDELLNLKSELDSSRVLNEFNSLLKVQVYERYIMYVFILFSILLISLFAILYRANKKTKFLNVILADQHVLISEQNEKLESAVETKNRIFSIIGHDLRGPISTMYSYLDLLSDVDTDVTLLKSIKEQLRIAMETSMNLLDNLVFWGQSQQEDIKPNIVKSNTSDLIKEVLLQQSIYASSKNITLSMPDNKGYSVETDVRMMSVILRNLLANAIKFTAENGTVSLNCTSTDETMSFEIVDSGLGMSKEQIETIRTGNVDSLKGTKNEKGYGLGLQLVKAFTKQLGGRIEINSKKGEGTRIQLKFPKSYHLF